MDWNSITDLAFRSRAMREIGIALFSASIVLALFIVVPLAPIQSITPACERAAAIESTTPAPDAYAQVALQAKAAIVYDLATGDTLYAKNADAQLPLASLTKLLAVYAAVSALPENAPVTISASATKVEYPRAFNEGQVLTLGDISRLTLTASLNDGAAAIVQTVAAEKHSSESAVLSAATDALDLSQTFALNGNGLDMSETLSGAYGSARDMARLSGALVAKAPSIAEATTRPTTAARTQGGTSYTVDNTDPIVHTIPHLLLSKTGFTDLAGGNLALVIDVGLNHPVAIVVLGSSKEARFTDSTALVAATLAHFAGVTPL